MPTFLFNIRELRDIAATLPTDQDTIRLTGYVYDSQMREAGGPDQVKCNGCNWEVTRLFVRADSRAQAEQLLASGDAGLCGECYAEMLAEA